MTQITVRNLDPLVENAIRQLANERNLSLSEVANQLLRQALKLDTAAGKRRNLADLAGTWSPEEVAEIKKKLKELEAIDDEI